MSITFDSVVPLASVATSTTRAVVAATTPAGCRGLLLSLDPRANAAHAIGDGTVLADFSTGVICILQAGGSVWLPIHSTAGLNVVAFTGGSASVLYAAVVK